MVRLERECSAYFCRLPVRRKEEREFRIWDLHGFAWRYYGSGLVVYCFHSDVCRYIGFLFILDRDFRAPGTEFLVFLEREICAYG